MKYRTMTKKILMAIICTLMLITYPVKTSYAYYTASNAANSDIVNKIRNMPASGSIYDDVSKRYFTANLKGNKVTTYPCGISECFAYVNEVYYYLFGKQFAYSYKGNKEGRSVEETAFYTGLVTLKSNDTILVDNIRRSNYDSESSYKTAVQQVINKAVPGDILVGGDGKKFLHFVVFMYATDANGDGLPDYIYTAEGNYNGKNDIVVEFKKSVNYFVQTKGAALSLYHCKSNPVASTTAASTSPSSPAQTNVASVLAINNVSEIGTINEGKTYSLTGSVTSNYNITNVTGTIYNNAGGAVYSKSVAPNKTSYTLRNSKIDNAMLFNKLSAGSYTYKVTATDAKGNYKEISKSFVIKGKTQAASAIAINGVNEIGTLNEGAICYLSGTVTSNYKLTNVTGSIYDSNGVAVYSKAVAPNATSYTLKNSAVDKAMLFNKLAAGSYTYKVSASDTAGGYREVSRSFSIKGRNEDAEAARAKAEAEAEARAAEEERARAEAQAKAEEEVRRQAEAQAKSENVSNNTERSSSSDVTVIVMPDHENEDISISGDTGRFDLHLWRSASTKGFTAASDRLTIVTRGQVEDLIDGSIRTDASRHFTMSLYDVTDGNESYVSGYYANCDDIEGGVEFDVQEGHQYKIRLSTSGLKYREAVIGDGHAYPVR